MSIIIHNNAGSKWSYFGTPECGRSGTVAPIVAAPVARRSWWRPRYGGAHGIVGRRLGRRLLMG